MTETQKIIWNIFLQLKAILNQEDIPYFMLGGTLLGAVRHQGFIPWDDDMDIGLKRKDYETFLRCVEDRLPPFLELHTYKNESTHHYYFSRIVDIRYQLKRSGSLVERNENVWVDVFPLDGMPNHFIPRRIHMIHLLILRMRYHIACFDRVNLKRPNRPLTERVVIWFIEKLHIREHDNYQDILDQIDKLLKKYNPDDSDWIVNFMGQYKFKEMFPKGYYEHIKEYPFNNILLPGPQNADAVLRRMYGNYMRIPKDSDKNVHDATLIEIVDSDYNNTP